MMKGSDVLRLVEQMHNDKNIPREIIFEGLEAAIQLAAEKKYGEESGMVVTIDRDSGGHEQHQPESQVVPDQETGEPVDKMRSDELLIGERAICEEAIRRCEKKEGGVGDARQGDERGAPNEHQFGDDNPFIY